MLTNLKHWVKTPNCHNYQPVCRYNLRSHCTGHDPQASSTCTKPTETCTSSARGNYFASSPCRNAKCSNSDCCDEITPATTRSTIVAPPQLGGTDSFTRNKWSSLILPENIQNNLKRARPLPLLTLGDKSGPLQITHPRHRCCRYCRY